MSHYNVGGLPEHMRMELIEPLREEFFKDEVRALGLEVGLSETRVYRQPLRPGLAVSDSRRSHAGACGTAAAGRPDCGRRDSAYGLYREIWQSFAVLLPIKSVGVMGDSRTYQQTCVVRAVLHRWDDGTGHPPFRGSAWSESPAGSSTRSGASTESPTTSATSRLPPSSGMIRARS